MTVLLVLLGIALASVALGSLVRGVDDEKLRRDVDYSRGAYGATWGGDGGGFGGGWGGDCGGGFGGDCGGGF